VNRRDFLSKAFQMTAAGVLVPAELLEIPKGRSMVSVPAVPSWPSYIISREQDAEIEAYLSKLKTETITVRGYWYPSQ